MIKPILLTILPFLALAACEARPTDPNAPAASATQTSAAPKQKCYVTGSLIPQSDCSRSKIDNNLAGGDQSYHQYNGGAPGH